jgi:membrane-bound metal-dependent hydrolase YbcI (DUF457 family)
MMGKTHALSSAATAAAFWSLNRGAVGLAEVVIGGSVMIGAALLPDIDHPNSTASKTFGPVTGVFCWIVGKLTGGHRRGTHSLFGVAVLGALSEVGISYRHGLATALVIVPMILALASLVRLFKIPGYLDDLAPVPVVLGIVLMTAVPLWYVPYALAAGCLVHIAGDLITKVKIPIFWPFGRSAFALGLISTNGTAERWIITPACLIIIIIGAWKGIAG